MCVCVMYVYMYVWMINYSDQPCMIFNIYMCVCLYGQMYIYTYIYRKHQLLKRIEKQHPAEMMESIWGSYGFGGLTITIFAYLQCMRLGLAGSFILESET